MMLEFIPTTLLDTSLLTGILVGVLVMWAFQETLGWNFTGLVVPGYLAGVIVIRPETGLIIALEGIATYGLVYLVSDGPPIRWPVGYLFGRDRFLAILIASVLVRLGLEAGGIEALSTALGYPLDPGLHSMGLLVVPLLANALWRMGLAQGVPRLGIPVALTWLLLQLVLLPYTNLSLASFELTYSDVAQSFVGAPRAYLLLLFGAWAGSVSNREWGWDHGGIIIPGLLAVCWLEPMRVVSTVGEAIVVAWLIALAVRLPGLRSVNWGGGRLLVMSFVLAYAAKVAVGWLVEWGAPNVSLRDLFGFGYLLSTLMALRIYKHGSVFTSLVPSVLTSFVGFLGGVFVGWGLAVVVPEGGVEERVTPQPGDVILAAYTATDQAGLDGLAAARWRTGGEGFGAWIQTDGNRLVTVSGRVGVRGGLAMATLDLAERLDARWVHLCGPAGDQCEAARASADRFSTVWTVEPGKDAQIHVVADDLGGTDLPALAQRFEGIRSVPREGTRPLAQLDDAAAYDVPVELSLPHYSALSPNPRGQSLDGAMVRAARVELVQPILHWLDGHEDALGAAQRAAMWLDASISRRGETVWVTAGDFQLIVRRYASGPIIYAPFGDAPGTRGAGVRLMHELDASALILDAPSGLLDATVPVRRLPWLATMDLADHGDREIIELRALRDYQDAMAEIVFVPESGEQPGNLRAQVEEALQSAARDVAGDYRDETLRPAWDPVPTVARLEGQRHLTVWLSSRARMPYVEIDSDASWRVLDTSVWRETSPTRWNNQEITLQELLDAAGPNAEVVVAADALAGRYGIGLLECSEPDLCLTNQECEGCTLHAIGPAGGQPRGFQP